MVRIKRAGMAEVEPVEEFGPGGVAEDEREALAPAPPSTASMFESTAT